MEQTIENSHGRGPQRFAGVTYAQIGEWVGLRPSTVGAYAQQGVFDRHDIESILLWANDRRARQGLPLIGVISTPSEPDGRSTDQAERDEDTRS